MLYKLLKAYARLAIRVYCTKVVINKPEVLREKGPILFAANHPNSFLDGIILTTLSEEPVHSLARGDAFAHPGVNRFLRALRLLPVYRTSEGVENLGHNYTTFASCQQAFQQKDNVLIFSEGRCENEWHLRPLKKGTARLATNSWQKGIPLKVIPLGFNYSSFKSIGKEVHLLFGEPILSTDIDLQAPEGRQWQQFNQLLHTQLQQLVYEIDEKDNAKRRKLFSIHKTASLYLLLLPALAGALLMLPLWLPIRIFTDLRFGKSGHYDSVLHSLLVMGFPLYLLLLLLIGLCFAGPWALVLLPLLPFLAWAAVQVKCQLDL